jgi:hypothetical protein
MVAKEVFGNYYNFNRIWVKHASIHESTSTQVKKVIFKVSKIYSEPGLEPEPEWEQEPKEIFSAPQHCYEYV